jgi:hypothetical protein
METIKRYAMALDMPPERLLGTGDTNHWNAWSITQDEWEGHGLPLARMLCEDWTTGYLRPTLMAPVEAGGAGMSREEAERVSIGADPSAIVIPADRTKDANEAHAAGTISDKAHRAAYGFNDDDAPKLGEPNSNPKVVQVFGAALEGQTETAAVAAPAVAAPADGSPGPGDTEPGPPATEDAATASARRFYVLEGAAMTAVSRMREAAGARIRQRAKNTRTDVVVREAIGRKAELPNSRLAAALGERLVQSTLNGHAPLDARQLIDSADEALVEVLRQLGVPSLLAAQLRGAVIAHAAATLYHAEPGPLSPLVLDACRACASETDGTR